MINIKSCPSCLGMFSEEGFTHHKCADTKPIAIAIWSTKDNPEWNKLFEKITIHYFADFCVASLKVKCRKKKRAGKGRTAQDAVFDAVHRYNTEVLVKVKTK